MCGNQLIAAGRTDGAPAPDMYPGHSVAYAVMGRAEDVDMDMQQVFIRLSRRTRAIWRQQEVVEPLVPICDELLCH